MHLNEPDFEENWIRYLAFNASRKKLELNKKYYGENEITDLLLVTTGCEAIINISFTTYPRELEEVTFNQIKEIILKNIRSWKRLFIAKWTKFLVLKQE